MKMKLPSGKIAKSTQFECEVNIDDESKPLLFGNQLGNMAIYPPTEYDVSYPEMNSTPRKMNTPLQQAHSRIRKCPLSARNLTSLS